MRTQHFASQNKFEFERHPHHRIDTEGTPVTKDRRSLGAAPPETTQSTKIHKQPIGKMVQRRPPTMRYYVTLACIALIVVVATLFNVRLSIELKPVYKASSFVRTRPPIDDKRSHDRSFPFQATTAVRHAAAIASNYSTPTVTTPLTNNNSRSNDTVHGGAPVKKTGLASLRLAGVSELAAESSTVRPWLGPPNKVIVAHLPRCDFLGSFVRPTLFLLAIVNRYGWELEILPFEGSVGEKFLKLHVEMGNHVEQLAGQGWGTGVQDVSHRNDYDPAVLNAEAYDQMGFFPAVLKDNSAHEWIENKFLQPPGPGLDKVCQRRKGDTCYIKVSQEYSLLENFVNQNGGLDAFFPLEWRQSLCKRFLAHNSHRLGVGYNTSAYNVAVHVRRGDINNLPARWTDQEVFYSVVSKICQKHRNVHARIFSSGVNKDGNWSTMERLSEICMNVTFHIDEYEFDSWTYMVAADTFVMSQSSFSYIPALLRTGEVFTQWGSGAKLSAWKQFDGRTGIPREKGPRVLPVGDSPSLVSFSSTLSTTAKVEEPLRVSNDSA